MAAWDWAALQRDTLVEQLVAVLNKRLPRLSRALAAPDTIIPLRYGPTVTLDCGTGREFQLTVTNGVAFTIAKPLNLAAGKVFWLTIINASGGVLGAITWDAVFRRDASFAAPANGKQRSIGFRYDGTSCVQRAAATGDC